MSGTNKSTVTLLTRLSGELIAKLPLAAFKVVAIASISVTGAVVGLRHLGALQQLELIAFDHLVQQRLDLGQDPRLLVVEVTDADIRKKKSWPLPDSKIALLLEKLQKHQPKAIGLDIYRDIPIEPGHQQLVTQLKKPNVISIRNIDTKNGPGAPPYVSPEQVGFNDVVTDLDGIVRRNVMLTGSDDGSLFSFSLQLALKYFQAEGIEPNNSPINPDYLVLKKATFIPLEKTSGGYQNADSVGYQILINYRSAHNVAKRIGFQAVLDGKIEPSWVKDKVVLIGTVAPSLKDDFYTPYSSAEKQNPKMFGVYIHAQMVSQLLDAADGKRPLFKFWSESAELLWIVSWIVVGSSLAWGLRHPVIVIAGIAVGIGGLYGTCVYLFNQSVWVPISAPLLGFILASGAVITYRAYEAQQQQRMVMKLLGQNTSPEVAQALWKDRDYLLKAGKLPGKKAIATMFFSDLRGFSTIAEQKEPEALLEWLNEFLEVITQKVIICHGIINKFTGDGIMAAFGVPMARTHQWEVMEDAQNAVDCALAISDALEELNRSWQTRGLPVIQMRIGIFTGPVVVGSLGGKDRLEYGIIGDTVNIASRLESCEKERQPSNCRILIGSETYVHLEERYLVEDWGLLPLKGKQQLVNVYRVVAKKPLPVAIAKDSIVTDSDRLEAINLPCCQETSFTTLINSFLAKHWRKFKNRS